MKYKVSFESKNKKHSRYVEAKNKDMAIKKIKSEMNPEAIDRYYSFKIRRVYNK